MTHCTGLASIAAACNVDLDIELVFCFSQYERGINDHSQDSLREVILECTSIYSDNACTRSHEHTGNGLLTASCTNISYC